MTIEGDSVPLGATGFVGAACAARKKPARKENSREQDKAKRVTD
jgi:hypothetical protein